MRMEKMYVTCMLEVVKLHNKFGLSMMVFRAVIGLRRCMVIYVDKFGLGMVVYVALCMVMLLYKVGLCIARRLEMMLYVVLRLEMMLYVVLRLEMEELITIGPCMALRLVIYLDMIGLFMVALQNFMVFLVTNVFMVALQNFMVFLEMNVFMVALRNFMVFLEVSDFMVALLNYMVFVVMDVFNGMNLWVLHQCQHHGNLVVEAVAESWNCRCCRMVHRLWSLEIGFVFVGQS